MQIACKTSFLSHSDPLFKRTRICKLTDLDRMENIKLIQKVVNYNCPKALKNLFTIVNSRSRNDGVVIKKSMKQSFLCKSIWAWYQKK